MNSPDFSKGIVEEAKVTGYLLAAGHPSGRSKARFFGRLGFVVGQWKQLANALVAQAANGDIVAIDESEFGVKYTIDGPVQTPFRERFGLRSVWIVEHGEDAPRLVTAYPL